MPQHVLADFLTTIGLKGVKVYIFGKVSLLAIQNFKIRVISATSKQLQRDPALKRVDFKKMRL